MEKRLQQILAGLCGLAFVLLLAALWRASTPEWKNYQIHYQQLEAQSATTAASKAAVLAEPPEIHQVMISGLQRTDRCTTCHVSVEDPTMKDAPEPYRYHVGLGPHSPTKFGCTVCHGGQGLATDKVNAHGAVNFWEEPLLPSNYVRATCGRCHTDGDVPGVPELTEGRNLFETSGCRGCHKLNGTGGTIGPDLTAEASLHHTPDWFERHFVDPAAVVANSAMPKLKLEHAQIRSLTFYMLSLANDSMGNYYASERQVADSNYGRQLFAAKDCITCHAIGGAGGRSAPDLAGVAARYSPRWLDELLANPQLANPGTAMPDYALDGNARKALIAYLTTAAVPADAQLLVAERKRVLTPAQSVIESGTRYFVHAGCGGCHGTGLEGGVPNKNAQGGEVPSLLHLAEDYTKDEVTAVVRNGRASPLENKAQPAPPLYMPTWKATLSDEDIHRIVEFLWSKQKQAPKEESW